MDNIFQDQTTLSIIVEIIDVKYMSSYRESLSKPAAIQKHSWECIGESYLSLKHPSQMHDIR